MTDNKLTNGIAVIRQALEGMTSAAGVYKISNSEGVVIYVGKAKNLAKRVINYTHPERLEYRIQSMVASAASLEIITTNTEAEALLLESNLIKKFEPKYNILLKDDKSYPYILITEGEFPRIVKHRGKRVGGKYYGPFASASAVNKSITDIQKAFLVRPCPDTTFNNRQRPCMEYQIKRCSAPCVSKISEIEYKELVRQANDFLSGKSREIQEQLVGLMEKESLNHNYEKAAVYRDRIKALNQIQAKQTIHVSSINDADIIGLFSNGGECCIQVFLYRGGQNLGNRPFFPKHTKDQSNNTILEAFISQFYSEANIPPKEIFICDELEEKIMLEESLSELYGYKVKIIVPKLGDKKQLVDNAIKNAKNALEQKLLGTLKQKQLLDKVAEIFGLKSPPKRIEVYDNSHISGTDQVGAMIVAGEEGFIKKAYRRFNIKQDFTKGDDYAMMREVLTRRFKRLKQDSPEKMPGLWPDLVLIDGGQGQLSIATQVFNELGLTADIIFAGISKGPDRNAGREQFHIPGREIFTLPYNDPAMYYLQTLRDEAHRFAIGSHRNKRSKSISKSALDEIPGIGAKRKKILLNHFGSADDVKNATLAQLANVEGIDKVIAEQIYNFFH
ncbi:MAG: excinuclease subunit [Rickettsiaceae bacterium]|jgi:excinuclease ABC subunit C|nr:excinuclease subunit [Rickettsiaceae bacterium]